MNIVLFETENGYTLCARHMAKWRSSGWNGASEPMSPEAAAEIVTGDPSKPLECADCAEAASTYPQPIASVTRTLANGERWHLLGSDTYAPVWAANLEAYADCITAGAR